MSKTFKILGAYLCLAAIASGLTFHVATVSLDAQDKRTKLAAYDASALTNLNASNLASGTVATARLGSGTASISTYLRGDQTWASVPGAGQTWYAMTDGATVTATWTNNATNSVTLGGNRTLAISGTPAKGERITLLLTQDATGARTITWPSSGVTISWPYGEEIILTTTAGATDLFELLCTDDTSGALVFKVSNAFLNLQ